MEQLTPTCLRPPFLNPASMPSPPASPCWVGYHGVVATPAETLPPTTSGLALFAALQRQGVPSKLLYFPDEGHWILKPQNSELWYQLVLGWFELYLKPNG